MDKRKYMTIIADFFDWCFLKHIELDDINDDILEEYIKHNDTNYNNEEVKIALDEFKSYL